MTLSLGILASHGGTNAQAIIDACNNGVIAAKPSIVISNNSKSMAMERARNAAIPAIHLSSVTHADPDGLDREMCTQLTMHDVDLVVLAGYMKRIGPATLAQYEGRVINIHPSLLPAFGGQGMFGMHVHEAVLESGVAQTGATVHLVDAHYDQGATLTQKVVPVEVTDTTESLAERVGHAEHTLYVETIRQIADGELLTLASR